MSSISNHPLIVALREIGLPPEDYAVFGSGPMMAHGLKESNDLDVIARGSAWALALAMGEPRRSHYGSPKADFAGGKIEVFNTWAPGEWDVDELIDGAEVIDGVRFVTLENVLKWKRLTGRPKDAEHIKLIENYLAKQ